MSAKVLLVVGDAGTRDAVNKALRDTGIAASVSVVSPGMVMRGAQYDCVLVAFDPTDVGFGCKDHDHWQLKWFDQVIRTKLTPGKEPIWL